MCVCVCTDTFYPYRIMTVIVFFLATIFGIFVGGMVLAQVGGCGQLVGGGGRGQLVCSQYCITLYYIVTAIINYYPSSLPLPYSSLFLPYPSLSSLPPSLSPIPPPLFLLPYSPYSPSSPSPLSPPPPSSPYPSLSLYYVTDQL